MNTCDICKRPRWDGGHALNMRECDNAGGDICLLLETIRRQTESLIVIRKVEEQYRAGQLTQGERASMIQEGIRRGLAEPLPDGTFMLQSVCKVPS